MTKTKHTTALLLGLLAWSNGQAAENGNISWPIGVNTVLNGVATQPGETRLYNYTLFYSADRLNDSAGDKVGFDVEANIFVNALRLDRGWTRTWGNTHLVSGFVLPVVDASIEIAGQKSTTTAVGNISLKPLIIGTHNDSKTFFQQIAPLDLDIPSGSYNSGRAANAAVNYYSWQPNYGWTWLPSPRVEIGGTLSAAINSKNDDTDYRSGWTLHYEQLLAYSITDKVQVGLQGFYFKQMSDDELSGDTYLDGYRVQGAALGPQVRYTFSPGVAAVVKYQREFASKNRSEGDRFWLQFTFPL